MGPQIIGFIVFLAASFAETNRLPFDLPEAESEIVAGYHTEYSSMKFALFFMAEYANMILVSCIAAILFLGGYNAPFPFLDFVPPVIWFTLKVYFFLFFFIWIRATVPRLRYDQLMRLGWKVMLPIALANIMVTAVIAYVVD